MRRTLVIAAVLATAGFIAIRAGASDSPAPPSDIGKPDSAGPRVISARVLDRGNTRNVWVANLVGSGAQAVGTKTIAANEQINVTAATLYVETNSSASFIGNVTLSALPGGPVSPLYPIQFTFTGHSTQHLTFNPPVLVRTGDIISYSSGTAPTFSRIELSLFGYAPGETLETGMMAR